MQMHCLVVSLTLLVLAACAQTGPYRNDTTLCELVPPRLEMDTCPKSSKVRVTGNHPYELSYVEIDEQGFFADRKQVESSLEFASAPPQQGRAYVIVFIHGWHHNAKADDWNVSNFHSALAALSKWHPDDSIRGIYVGWRGDSIAIPGLRYTTFWDRKNTSDEVGRGSLYEFLIRLERAVKVDGNKDNRLVLVGHSFGASVTFNALAQRHMQRFLDGIYAFGPGRRFHGYGDLVVLVNPAIEAMRYMPFNSALNYYAGRNAAPRADFSSEVNPILLILSSEGDVATRKVFPVARALNVALEAHQSASILGSGSDAGDYSEWQMDVKTVGNYEKFHTHETLHLRSSADVKDPMHPKECHPLHDGGLAQMILASEEHAQIFPDSFIEMKRKPGGFIRSPYWVANVGTEIVKDHTNIGNLNLICWISQLVDSR
jgi:pimeloyl-ACP methyl ester carboxylesterase